MAQWKLKAECMRGEEREQLRELVTTRYHVAGSPEARTIARVIPPTFSAMVARAGQDNNHLQKAVRTCMNLRLPGYEGTTRDEQHAKRKAPSYRVRLLININQPIF
jgi:hypothetical protein